MDPFNKKRKPEENGTAAVAAATASATPPPSAGGAAALGLTRDDLLRLLEPLSRDQLAGIAATAALVSGPALDAVRAAADRDPSLRKLFVRGLGWETTSDALRGIFSAYGDLEEAVVISDKATGRSKGYGFITFRHADCALLALKEPSKKIDGRMTVTQLAAAGAAGGVSVPASGGAAVADVSLRKIFVGNVPSEMPSERLLSHFASYGEIEEGPLGFDKQTGKFRGFALFVYKTPEGAQASLAEPVKVIDGYQLVCKLAIEGKKGKQQPSGMAGAMGQQGGGVQDMSGAGMGLGASQLPGQYGGPGNALSSYAAFAGAGGGMSGNHPYANLPSSMGGGGGTAGLGSMGNQVPSSLGATGAGGYGAGGLGTGSYGPSSQFGGAGPGSYGGLGMGGASSLYRMPQTSGGLPSGGYGESGNYSLPSAGFRGQDPQQAGLSPGPGSRAPPMYPNVPPYF